MRIRFRYAKLGKVRFTSQRDVARMWERALRRAGLPVAYSHGFSPRPQLSFGLALPTCCESLAEYLEVVLEDGRSSDLDVASLPEGLSARLPAGVEALAAAPVGPGGPSLQEAVTSCEWEIRLGGVTASEVTDLATAFLAADAVPVARERKGRQVVDDIRASVHRLRPLESGAGADPVAVVAEVATQPRGLRPAELVRGLAAMAGVNGTEGHPVIDRACRTKQWIERDGRREEPLPMGDGSDAAGRAGRTEMCAP